MKPLTSDGLFAEQLARFGPCERRQPCSLTDAQHYCRRLAATHYENFTVGSWLLPRDLRQHFANVYAYCRWADDLADETIDGHDSLALLDWWEQQLRDCYRGEATHPVFISLSETVREFEIPIQPWLDLLTAFRQDQRVARYETFDELLGYCRNSANPVGRLVLHLGRCATPDRAQWSDSICTGLQLANFLQDVAGDWDRGRIYVPRESLKRFGYDETAFGRRECNDTFRRMMATEVDRAEQFLLEGLPLVRSAPEKLRVDVELFIRGGQAILQRIRAVEYDVWSQRPRVSRWQRVRLLGGCLWRAWRGR